MTDAEQKSCLVCALLRRLRTQHLPWIFAIKERLDHGERVTNDDIRYLYESFSDAIRTRTLFEKSPDLTAIGVKVIALYREISIEALENENGLRI
jgi:hypothetical protein